MTQKWEENIPKFYFCVRAPTFSRHMPCPLKICLTNKVNTICGGGQLLVTGPQGPITRFPGVRIPYPRVTSPKALGPSSRVPSLRVQSLRVPNLRSQGPGSRVPGPDFRLCLLYMTKKPWQKLKYLRTKRAFRMKSNAFSSFLKGLYWSK